ncbi:unnamed protein product [Allacma fusca]|uniref:Uncharacterized protein n=1 Tax=Allacma fusca TaxID=39272 RepID=A0A8J2P8C9_9HEXA|nr:unnamed protein product [Allacma fusca]
MTELNIEFTKVISDITAQLANNFSKILAEPDQIQSLQNVSETVSTFNVFASKLESLLSALGIPFSTELSEDVKIEGNNCKTNSPLKLVQWLRPFEDLRKITNLTKVATKQLNDLKLEGANLQVEISNSRELWESQLNREEETFKSNASNVAKIHKQNLQHLQESFKQSKSHYQLEINEEKQKSNAFKTECQERAKTLNEEIDQERKSHRERIQDINRAGDKEDAQQNALHLTYQNQQRETCTQNLAIEEKACKESLTSITTKYQQEDKDFENKLKAEKESCKTRQNNAMKDCDAQKTLIKTQAKRRTDSLNADSRSNDNACSGYLKAKDSDCTARLNTLNSTIQSIIRELPDKKELQDQPSHSSS